MMLLRTIVLLALIAILAETLLHGAAALAQAALRQRALDAARLALVSGTYAAQAAIAQGTAPAPVASCAYADADGCAISVATTFGTPAPSPSPSTCPDTPCTVIMQSNTAVGEGRAAYVISVVASAANGAPLAARSAIVNFRTFAAAPYASIVGGADATLDALANGGPGDDAGAPATLITVEYDPAGGGSATPGNVWQPAIENPPLAAPAWDR